MGGEGGAGGESVFDLALRSYRFESITLAGRTEGPTYTDAPIRIETAFHEYAAHSGFSRLHLTWAFFFKCAFARETDGLRAREQNVVR